MKCIGIIVCYDGYNGCLIDIVNNMKFIFKKDDVVSDYYFNKGDVVKYDAEMFKGRLIARFVEKS